MHGRLTFEANGRAGTAAVAFLIEAAAFIVAQSSGVLLVVTELVAGFVVGRLTRGGWPAVMFGGLLAGTPLATAMAKGDLGEGFLAATLFGLLVFLPGYFLGDGTRTLPEAFVGGAGSTFSGNRKAGLSPLAPLRRPAGWAAAATAFEAESGEVAHDSYLSRRARVRIALLILGAEGLIVAWVMAVFSNGSGP